MNAGILRDYIEVWKPNVTKDEMGARKVVWEKHYSCKAYVRYASGTQSIENHEVTYPTTYRFIVRKYVPVKEIMRIKFEDQFYDIESIMPNSQYNNKEIYARLVNK